MSKVQHEVRDAVHGFVRFNNLEKRLIDSAPFQRLRGIHQLAMCYQVYPGATHTRFEHSLGVMEAADRIFRAVFDVTVPDGVRERIADEVEPRRKEHWRQLVRVAALLHDIGHLPFSHAAERELLPEGWNHERITAEMIRKSEIAGILEENSIRPEDVVDLAWDVRKRSTVDKELKLSPWKTLLNEIITGNTFGADRIDYLLRDSWHAGVTYGRFDADRLIGGLRAVIDPGNQEIALGLDVGYIHSAEALLLARYFMYTQVYFHDVRRVYDLHLKDFLKEWLDGGQFPSDWRELIGFSDHEVIAAIRKCAADPSNRTLQSLAARLISRKHFRTVFELLNSEKKRRPTIFGEILDFSRRTFGDDQVRWDHHRPKSEANDFPVLIDEETVKSSLSVSEVIDRLPPIEVGLIFVDPDRKDEAKRKIDAELKRLRNEPSEVESEAKGGS
jgi:HD superfamily phosphohydrolase